MEQEFVSQNSSPRASEIFQETVSRTLKLQWSFYWREDKVIQVEFRTAFMSLYYRDTSLGEKAQMEREKAAGKT